MSKTVGIDLGRTNYRWAAAGAETRTDEHEEVTA